MRRLINHARAMRCEPTPAEQLLWRHLRGNRLGVRFRRQHPVGGYILDFFCPSANLAVELDGAGHAEEAQRNYDARRTRDLSLWGIRVFRVWNTEVVRDVDRIVGAIWRCVHEGAPVPEPRGRIDGGLGG